jgi:hypothetical protein
MNAIAGSLATACRLELARRLAAAGIEASLDAGAFYPQPLGVLIGLPAMIGRTLGGARFETPVLVVSGDPLNDVDVVDRLYALADQCAEALPADVYRPSSFRGGPNAEPLPALEFVVVLKPYEEEL